MNIEIECMELDDGTIIKPHGKDANGEPLYDLNQIEKLMGNKAVSLVENAAERIGLMEKVHGEALKALTNESGIVNRILIQTREAKKEIVEMTRSMRMTVKSETSETIKRLEDVRQFFLGSDYKIQTERLKEFCDLCERLESLKKSGFLDDIADTILKLS